MNTLGNMIEKPERTYDFIVDSTGRSIVHEMMSQLRDVTLLAVIEHLGIQRDSLWVLQDAKKAEEDQTLDKLLIPSDQELETIKRW